MKKRMNPAWRIVIALLLLFALAPVVALSIPAQAGAPPDTYINDIPEYLGTNTHPVVIAGTAIADSPSTVDQVKVQITYEANDKTYYWTGGLAGAWTVIETTLIAPFVIGAPSLWTPQYDWSVGLPLGGDLADGEEYTVTAWSEDAPASPIVWITLEPGSSSSHVKLRVAGVGSCTMPGASSAHAVTVYSSPSIK